MFLAPAPVSGQDDDDKPEVVDLRFQGVRQLKVKELRESIVTDESHCKSLVFKPVCWFTKSRYFYERQYLDRDELIRDVLRLRVFYWKRGFRETQVDTVVAPRDKDKVAVTFIVNEGPPTIVSDVTVTQTRTALSNRDIERRTLLKSGDPLNMIKLDSMRVRLEQLLWDRGYADAIVDTSIALSQDGGTADVQLNLNPRWLTTIQDIHVHGNEKVSERTIRRSLTFEEGDLFLRSDMLRSQRNLYESNLFRRAVIEVSKDETTGVDSTKILDITVQESPQREARLSFGFTTADFLQAEGRYTHYNFTGGARRLTVTGAVGNILAEQLNNKLIFSDNYVNVGSDRGRYFAPTYNASAEMQQPWFGSARNALALSVFTHRRSAPGIYVDRGYGTSATFTREVMFRAPASLNYRFEVTTVEAGDVYFCVNFGVCDRPTLDALRGHQRISPLTLTANIDRTNDPFSPNRGFRGRTALEHASGFTASDYRFNRASAEAAAFMPIRRRGALGGRIRLGWVKGIESTGEALGGGLGGGEVLHPRTRFFAGGAQSVRGFGENQLGPRVLTVSAAELRAGKLSKDGPNACPEPTPITQCDPNSVAYQDEDFQPRPLGGNTVAEANVELRFPVWQQLSGAVFIDAGVVTQNIDRTLPGSRAAITPGFGVRYRSPVGPIRVDIGINPGRAERLPVISEEIVNGERRLVRLDTRREYAVSRGGFMGLMDRMVLHLSIGEAF
ncbi:MAG TPA: BamA/TamA family outer membrane protein [Gemmatimonadaceae bacterium]|nr:BamA/TamA family outer membrane protein [Gemmatimonadaceae bacterium]